MNKKFTMEGSIHTDVSGGVGQGLKGTADNSATMAEGVPSLTHPQLISRGLDVMEEPKRAVLNGTSGANVSSSNKTGSTEQ